MNTDRHGPPASGTPHTATPARGSITRASKGSSIPRRQACGSGSAADRARGRQFCGVIMIKKKKKKEEDDQRKPGEPG